MSPPCRVLIFQKVRYPRVRVRVCVMSMSVSVQLSSYWGNFKIFLHGEWNEKFWIVCRVWNCLASLLCKKFAQIVYVWTYLNSLNILNILNKLNKFLNRLNRFLTRFLCVNMLNRFFFMKFLWNLNRFCCYFLSKLSKFCVNRLILLLFFKQIE